MFGIKEEIRSSEILCQCIICLQNIAPGCKITHLNFMFLPNDYV